MTALRLSLRTRTAPKGVLFLMTAAAFALAACGGGGGGSGSGSGLHGGGHVEAARATPTPGSVTQSSVGSGVTAKSVTTTIELDSGNRLTPKVLSDGWGFENQPVVYRETVTINGTVWQGMDQIRTYSDGSKRFVRTFTDATPGGDPGNDYLVMGYWLRVPQRFVASDGSIIDHYDDLDDFVKSIEYGVFVNGGDPYEQANILALQGTATYAGDATAFYIDTVNNKESALRADVSITANFGSATELGTVSGTVNNFERYDDGAPEPQELTNAELTQLGNLILGTADIGNSDSGFFTGDTSMTVNGDGMTGKWGGQFYGNNATNPEAVAGTYGAANSVGTKVIIGTYATN